DEVVLIEWPERAEALLPPDRWEARLGFVEDEDGEPRSELRRLGLTRVGEAPVPPSPEGGAGEGAEAGTGDGAGGVA
ncbi:MAG: hypothetical protein GWN71_23970, partial [Gammaproteobacteria bacterium]|nr:hypothetical protein [Gammaproteobacteria bacterium]